MSTTSRVAGAVAAGYVLGRFKKLRLAVLVGSAMASPKFRNAAAGMIENRIPGGAVTTTLTKEVGGRLVNIGKTAATSIVASRIDNLSQSLADRSQNLRGGRSGEQADKSRADEEEGEETQEPEDDYDDTQEPEDEYDEEEGEETQEPEDEYDEEEGEETQEPEDEYDEEEGEETQEPEDEYDQEGEETQEQDAQASDDASEDEEPEEPVTRSPRRRRSASPAGRRRG
jgi:cobalamin biosynthesis protein CobT